MLCIYVPNANNQVQQHDSEGLVSAGVLTSFGVFVSLLCAAP